MCICICCCNLLYHKVRPIKHNRNLTPQQELRDLCNGNERQPPRKRDEETKESGLNY